MKSSENKLHVINPGIKDLLEDCGFKSIGSGRFLFFERDDKKLSCQMDGTNFYEEKDENGKFQPVASFKFHNGIDDENFAMILMCMGVISFKEASLIHKKHSRQQVPAFEEVKGSIHIPYIGTLPVPKRA